MKEFDFFWVFSYAFLACIFIRFLLLFSNLSEKIPQFRNPVTLYGSEKKEVDQKFLVQK